MFGLFGLALVLLILGSGLLKGNIAAQVGQLFPTEDESTRTRAYAIFSMGINVGAVAGPLACGLVAQIYGWHVGFGLAGVMMLVAMITYLAIAILVPVRQRNRLKKDLAANEWKACTLAYFHHPLFSTGVSSE